MITDIFVALILFFLGKIQFKYRAVKVSGTTAIVSATILIPLFVASAIIFVFVFKYLAVAIAGILFLIAKWKVFITLKLGYLIGGIAGGIFGIFSGPIGWFAIAIILLLAAGYMYEFTKEAFITIYTKYLSISAGFVFRLRKISDSMNEFLGLFGIILFFPFEFIIISILPVWGLAELWDFFFDPFVIDLARAQLRLVILLIFSLAMYADYRRATSLGKDSFPDVPDILDIDGEIL